MNKLSSMFFKYVFLSTFFTTTKSLNAPSPVFKEEDFERINILVIVLASTLPIVGPLIVKCFRKDLSYCRLFSLWSYFSMVILINLVVAMAIVSLQSNIPLFFTINVTAAVLIPFYYLYILLEAQYCKEKRYLDYSSNNDEIDDYLNVIYESNPRITFEVVCYHQVTHDCGEYSYTEDVTTHTESANFDYKSCRDLSDRSEIPSARKSFTQINLSKVLSFRDEETGKKFVKIQSDLVERNKNKDLQIRCNKNIEFPGLKDKVKSSNAKRPFWMNKFYFQLAHFLTLSWPYRWFLNRNVQRINHSINKEISIFENRQTSSNVPYSVIQ
ncbi:uncharacterized protein LOC136077980 [Hydra vulgaris]|uniref:Uncharacterized protein LOC136077980 n=1 Tax=Hydra vulgaris TaxID=6087 RepID=A0ABM4BHQ2_HYDVU